MIEIMNGSAGNVVGMRALFCMDPDFRGWKLSAAWENTKLDFRFRGTLDATWATRTVNARIVPTAVIDGAPVRSLRVNQADSGEWALATHERKTEEAAG